VQILFLYPQWLMPFFIVQRAEKILLPQAILIYLTAFGQPAGFDFFVLLTGIAFQGNWDESCVDDLPAAGLEALGAEVCLKHLQELFNQSRFTQSLPKEGNCSCIWNGMHDTKTNKHLEGAPIIHLEFKLLIANVKSSWSTSILKRISESILFRPVLLFRSSEALIKKRSK
jgi:hypothetical protein